MQLDVERNQGNAPVISADRAAVTVRVIPTEEESMIVREVVRLLRASQTTH